ncbi:MAG: sigma-70 family RNA polymerase sigma factor [Prevotellaceae bacterium]|jgi:RNA polymerase sigma-70 factor (ECF subfamily)|nr:sigma-70 family RNA polymerase sigma factor [Prevotellaceae bacterium]
MENKNESILLSRTLHGNTVAFAQLVDMYKAMVFNIIVKILQSREEAEECTQDVFIKVYQSLSSFKSEARFSTWLYRIAFNMAISRIRKKRIKTEELNENIYQTVTEDEIYSNFEKWNPEEQRVAIDKAIKTLSPDEAVIITLFYMEEKTVEEVAFITDLTKANVKVKLHRSRKKLYTVLNDLMERD